MVSQRHSHTVKNSRICFFYYFQKIREINFPNMEAVNFTKFIKWKCIFVFSTLCVNCVMVLGKPRWFFRQNAIIFYSVPNINIPLWQNASVFKKALFRIWTLYYVLIPGLDVFVLAIIIMNFLAILEYMIIMAKLSKYRNRTHTTDYEKALEFAQKMDRYSAMIFPIALVVFLLIYFVYYEAISPTVDIRDGLSKQTL